MRTVRILLSSPGDVAEERQKARQVIEHLQQYYRSRVALVPVLWEDLPLGADASFQEGIDLVLADKHCIDIAVFILWSRLGSPLGRPPKPDGTPYRSGTEREFDMMMEARHRSAGKRPHIIAYMRDDDAGFRRALTTAPREQLTEMIGQHSLVQHFIEERFQDELGRNQRAYHTYDRPLTFAHRLKVHLRVLIDEILGEATAVAIVWDQSPYRGLQVFDTEHAPIFFGREHEVCEVELLLRRRAETGSAFVVIVGASGSGKSSLARAGIAANLLHANLDDTVKEWRLAVMQPSALQGDVFGSLVSALADVRAVKELSIGGPDALVRFQKSLVEAPETALSLKFADALHSAAQSAGGPVRVLLLVDQLEELWSDKQIGPERRDSFLRTLGLLARRGHVWVLATLRADFYPLATQCEPFVRIKRSLQEGDDCDGVFELTAPDPAAVHRLIKEPALLAGLSFEKDELTSRSLDQDLLRDASGQVDALPLIEYALQQLFEARTPKGELTFDAYKKIGGLEKALGMQAEATFHALPDNVQAAFPQVIRALVTVSGDAQGQVLRRTSTLGAITDTPNKQTLADAFIARRFFTSDLENGVPVVRIAHEALLRNWERLSQWIADNHESLRLLSRVEQACARWRESGTHPSLLLPDGLPLEEAKKLQQENPDLLTNETAAFISRSVGMHLEQARHRARKRRLSFAALSTLAALAIGAAGWAFVKQGEARKQSESQRRLLNEYSENDRTIAFDLSKQGKWRESLAYFARSLQSNPDNLLAARQTFLTVLYGEGPRVRIPVRLESVPAPEKASKVPYEMYLDGTNLVISESGSTNNLWPPSSFAPAIRYPVSALRSENYDLLAVTDGSRSEIYNPLSTSPRPVVIPGVVTAWWPVRSNDIALVRFDRPSLSTNSFEERSGHIWETSNAIGWRIVNLSQNVAIDLDPATNFLRRASSPAEPPANPVGEPHELDFMELPHVAVADTVPVARVLAAGRAGFVDLATGTLICTIDSGPTNGPAAFQIGEGNEWAAFAEGDGSVWYYDLIARTASHRELGDKPCLRFIRETNSDVLALTRAGSVIKFNPTSTNEPRVLFTEIMGEISDPEALLDLVNGTVRFNCNVNGKLMRCTWDLRQAEESLAGNTEAFVSAWSSTNRPKLSQSKELHRFRPGFSGDNVYSVNAVGYINDPKTGETYVGEIEPWFHDPENAYVLNVRPQDQKLEIWDANRKVNLSHPLPFTQSVKERGSLVKKVASSSRGLVKISIAITGDVFVQLPPRPRPGGTWLERLATAASGLRLSMDGRMEELPIDECYRMRDELVRSPGVNPEWADFLNWWTRIGSVRGGIRLQIHPELR